MRLWPSGGLWERRLTELALVGGAIAFAAGLYQYIEAQRWRRAERVDAFIDQFESRPLLRLAAAVLDWTERRVVLGSDDTVKFTDDDVQRALGMKPPPEVNAGARGAADCERAEAATEAAPAVEAAPPAEALPTTRKVRKDGYSPTRQAARRLRRHARFPAQARDGARHRVDRRRPTADYFWYWLDRLERMPWHAAGTADAMDAYVGRVQQSRRVASIDESAA